MTKHFVGGGGVLHSHRGYCCYVYFPIRYGLNMESTCFVLVFCDVLCDVYLGRKFVSKVIKVFGMIVLNLLKLLEKWYPS